MAARAVNMRWGCSGLGLCLALAACGGEQAANAPHADSALPQRIVGPATVVDAGTLVIDGRTVKLWGIDAPARDAHCRDQPNPPWPCGEHAAAALAGWLGARAVNCDPRTRYTTNPALALCRLNGRDVGKWLVMHGWARDAPAQSDGMYRTLERAAARKRRGMHGGPPAVREASPS
jgi:endonuclease YncB( thermonuclease family)